MEKKLFLAELAERGEQFFGELERLSCEAMAQIQYSIEKLQGGKYDVRESVLVN
jgi:hypothetical protein